MKGITPAYSIGSTSDMIDIDTEGLLLFEAIFYCLRKILATDCIQDSD